MKSVRVTVVVPVFNAQRYLPACLSHIRSQTLRDWECICVDDGSSDDSYAVVRQFIAEDSRFSLLRQRNGGPGVARNTGLELAQGRYFCFVDADDIIHPQMLEKMVGNAESHSADLVACSLFRFRSDDEVGVELATALPQEQLRVFEHPLLPRMVDWKTCHVHSVAKLYLRELYGDLRFPPLSGAEDDYYSFNVYARSKRAIFSTAQLYGYRVVNQGLTRSAAKYRNYIEGDTAVAVHAERLLSEHAVDVKIRKLLVGRYLMRTFAFLNQMCTDNRISRPERLKLLATARRGLQSVRQSVSGSYRLVPPVHYVPYCSVRLGSLRLLMLWQWIRACIHAMLKGSIRVAPKEKHAAGVSA